jgi:predicted dehydrogenase
MKDGRLRGALIGCGFISEYHLRAWARIPEIEIVALADPDRSRAEQRRAAFAPQAKVYPSLEAVLAAESLDFVDLLTLPEQHPEQCLRAKAAGLHVACQKPLASDLGEACSLVKAFAGYPRLFSVHENHIYRPWFQRMARDYRAKAFGSLRWLRLDQEDPALPPQDFCRTSRRGVLLIYGVHLIDMVRNLLGAPESVECSLQRISERIRGESLAHVTFRYPEATAVVDVAWKDGGLGRAGAVLVGDAGEAAFEGTMTRGGPTRLRLVREGATVLDETRASMDDFAESFYAFERAFADAMLGTGPAPQPAAENLRTLEMTFAAYAAADRGGPVRWSEFAGP